LETLPIFEHEQLHVRCGTRSGLTVAVAIHSTRLGPAIGGCRIWHYKHWGEAVADVLRLSAAMSLKNAAAGLQRGGGKSVICLPEGQSISAEVRRAAVLDLGDLIEELDGQYSTGQDVGSTLDDMRVLHQRTNHILGLPLDLGGPGGTGDPTALGVLECIRATAHELRGHEDLQGLRVVISGLGQVGASLARKLAQAGAVLTLGDIDGTKRTIAKEVDAAWSDPEVAHLVPADIFVPAGVGGVMTTKVISELAARAVVGPANNPLADPDGDKALAARGILYAPDFVVNAGGSIFLTLMNEPGAVEAAVTERIRGIGESLSRMYRVAAESAVTPLEAAKAIAENKIHGSLEDDCFVLTRQLSRVSRPA
jgi:leucine dehydrogenase